RASSFRAANFCRNFARRSCQLQLKVELSRDQTGEFEMRLKDKVAIITGAGSGFGKAMAELFASEGAKVVVSDLNGAAATAVCKGIADAGGSAISAECDVTSATDLDAMTAATLKAFGRIDVLVNNAGFPQRNGSMFDVDEATFDKIFNVNVKSLYLTTKTIVPHILETKGNIVNIASTAALSPRPGLTWYNASKGAVVTMSKSMALELAPKQVR